MRTKTLFGLLLLLLAANPCWQLVIIKAFMTNSNRLYSQSTRYILKPLLMQQRGLIDTHLGAIHYCIQKGKANNDTKQSTSSSSSDDEKDKLNKKKLPLLAFHMSPRSVDEFADHHLPADQLVIAFDEFGYGASDNPIRSCTLDEIADCIIQCCNNVLEIDEFMVVGSLMGCYFCTSLASRYPDRVKGVILTNFYHWPESVRQATLKENAMMIKDAPIKDPWSLQDDGSHITDLWERRADWLDPVLNTRVVLDEITHLLKRRDRYIRGVYIQDAPAYDLEAAVRKIDAPVLCIQGDHATKFFDAIGYNMTEQFARVSTFFKDPPKVVLIDNPGSINLVNDNAVEWSRAVQDLLDKIQGL